MITGMPYRTFLKQGCNSRDISDHQSIKQKNVYKPGNDTSPHSQSGSCHRDEIFPFMEMGNDLHKEQGCREHHTPAEEKNEKGGKKTAKPGDGRHSKHANADRCPCNQEDGTKKSFHISA